MPARGRRFHRRLPLAGSTCSYYGVTLWQLDFGGGIYLQNALGASLELPAYVLMKVRRALSLLAHPSQPSSATDQGGPGRQHARLSTLARCRASSLAQPRSPSHPAPAEQVLADNLGRRACWAIFLCTITIALVLLSTLPHDALEGVLGTALALLARVGASGASTIAWLATTEQYPTSCRNAGMGYGAACGRLGSILAPIVVNLLPAPGVWLGLLCFVSTLCVLPLHETRGAPVSEALADGAVAAAARRTLQPPPQQGGGARTTA